MSSSKQRNEQKRGDDFEAIVFRFLNAIGYTRIEKQPEIETKRADLIVTRATGRFIVEAKSPHLMRGTLFDPDHFARVAQFERNTVRYVKKRFQTLYQNCIITGSWHGFLGRGIATEEIREWLKPLEDWVGREKELPTDRELGKWFEWLDSFELEKSFIENHPELEPDAVRLLKSKCPFYDDIPSYPYGRISIPITMPRQGKPQEWQCKWRLVRRDRYHPVNSGFTFFGWGGPGGSWHRIELTVKKAIKDYKKKLKLAERQYPELPCVPLVLFLDGRTAWDNLDKDDLDSAFARGVWKGGPSKSYPKIPLGVVVLGTPMHARIPSVVRWSETSSITPIGGLFIRLL